MKIELYLDLYPGMQYLNNKLTANTHPSQKSSLCERYKIIADIPDSAFTGEIDGEVKSSVEEVEDE